MFAAEEKRSPLKPILIGLIAILLGGAGFWYMNTRTTSVVSIPRVQLYAAHTTIKPPAGKIHIVGEMPQVEDNLYVVATLRIKNNLNIPIFFNSLDATYTAPDDSVMDTKAATHTDVEKLELSFPDITPLMTSNGAKPFPLNDTIPPGATVEGSILLPFSGLTAQTWKARKSATITVNYTHQPPQTITIP